VAYAQAHAGVDQRPQGSVDLENMSLRQRLDRLFDDTWSAGVTYETRWQLVRDYLRPTRYREVDSDANRGDKSFERILDPTLMRASDIARAGLLAGLANPARPWFMYGLSDRDPDPPLSVTRWLTEFRDITLDVMRRSNFYTALESAFGDDFFNDTATTEIYTHPTRVIHCHDFPIGSYRLANDQFGRCNVFAREVTFTADQCVRRFGWDNCSQRVQDAYKSGNRQATVDVRHLVAPNDGASPSDGRLFAKNLPWKECYWEDGGGDRRPARDHQGHLTPNRVLRETGYHDFPIITSRWMRSEEDNHGTLSPGIMAVSLARRLFQMLRTGLNAFEKEVDPPIKAPTSMMNRAITLASREITFYDLVQGNAGPEKLHDINIRYDHLQAWIGETKAGIEACYMVDLFLAMIQDSRGQPPTAEEIRARQREKLQILGPVHERKAPETLGPSVERVASILIRASQGAWAAGEDGIIPRPPPELEGRVPRVEFISEVAQSQKLVGLDSLERYGAFIAQTAEAHQDPAVLDNIDTDEAAALYADMIGVSPTVRRSAAAREARRAQRAQDAAIAQTVEAAPQVAAAARDLSEARPEEGSVLSNLLARAAS
jgi:hypothetical protein